jgi:hypothetical protein
VTTTSVPAPDEFSTRSDLRPGRQDWRSGNRAATRRHDLPAGVMVAITCGMVPAQKETAGSDWRSPGGFTNPCTFGASVASARTLGQGGPRRVGQTGVCPSGWFGAWCARRTDPVEGCAPDVVVCRQARHGPQRRGRLFSRHARCGAWCHGRPAGKAFPMITRWTRSHGHNPVATQRQTTVALRVAHRGCPAAPPRVRYCPARVGAAVGGGL